MPRSRNYNSAARICTIITSKLNCKRAIRCWIEKLYANDMFVDKPVESMLRDMLYDDHTGQLHFVDFENYNKTFDYQRNNNAIILQEFKNLFKFV
uniref:Uncharacterized protein n=1 Tax=Anticarsia gemmatalis multiple nucleopolyhedrovirus TaxID=268591 RepID=A0A0S3IXK7_9ABAC|nr:hypothetical protein AGNV_040 [Anticarsia gemmatalis multiple nucleopolyhedrovirus]